MEKQSYRQKKWSHVKNQFIFTNAAKTAEEALSSLKQNEDLPEYQKSIEQIITGVNRAVEEVPVAACFLTFTSEYKNLAARIQKII